MLERKLPSHTARLEIKQKLTGVGLPTRGAIPDDDPAPIGIDGHIPDLLIFGKLALQGMQHLADTGDGDLGIQQALGRLEQQKVLKSEVAPS